MKICDIYILIRVTAIKVSYCSVMNKMKYHLIPAILEKYALSVLPDFSEFAVNRYSG